MRRLVWKIGLCSLLVAMVCGIAFAWIRFLELVTIPSDAYASDWTAVFVIEHLKSSDDSWPTDWEDLRDEFDRLAEPSQYAWTFNELQDRVDLRFDVTAEQVRDSKTRLAVFALTSGREVWYNGDPNKLIKHYLLTGEGGAKSIRRTAL